ncbi:MAG: gephyrin-like molybdotransferase Glp [Variovorax sp.]
MNRTADIAHAPAAHDAHAMRVDEVQACLARLVAPLALTECETVPLHDALGRVLADDVVSPISVPPHDNSAMDGFAFDGAVLETTAPQVSLRLAGSARAGVPWHGALGRGEALRIMTGAVMPCGADTVVPQELCALDGDTLHFSANALRRGDNRRLAGEDLVQGRPALLQGERLMPAALGLLASLGMAEVQVRRRLRVAVFSTGDEILNPGDAARAGGVYDSNRFTLLGLLVRLGCEVIDLGAVRDNPAALAVALGDAANRADAIITSGGVSVGEADHTRAVTQRLGDVAFWSVAMRPGRPMAVGTIARTTRAGAAVLFGLPGNPVAVMVTFLAFVRTALLQLMGCHAAGATPAPLLRARSVSPIRKKPGRTEYQRGRVTHVPGGLPEVRVAGNQGSGVLSSMVESNGLVVLHHAQGSVAAGDEVDVMMFDGAM